MDTLPDETAEKPNPEAPEPKPEAPAPKPRRKRKTFVVAIVMVLALGVGAVVGYRPFVVWYLKREAKAQGVDLSFADFDLRLSGQQRVFLTDVRVELEGVTGVSARADKILILLKNTKPLLVDAQGMVIAFEGPLDDRLTALSVWMNKHPSAMEIPLAADLKASVKDPVALTLTGRAEPDGLGGGRFVGSVEFEGTNLGAIGARWTRKGPFVVGLGAKSVDEVAQAKVTLEVDPSTRPMKLSMKFVPTKIDELARALGKPAPEAMRGATAEGSATLLLFAPDSKGKTTGSAQLALSGWVPPHPRELDGIVFGDKTTLGATFEIMPGFEEMRLSKATVDAGAFHLAGKGNVTRKSLSFRTRMDLSGQVACSELGASAIGSRTPKGLLPELVGGLLQGAARMALGGSVGVRVQVDAESTALERAKVDQAVDIGCRLGP